MAKNPNIDDDTRKRAKAFVDSPRAVAVEDDATKRLPVKKERIVSKKELEESGLSLRDFLNKERGLKRRDEPSKPPEDKYMKERMEVVDRETQGDFLVAMKYKPRRTDEVEAAKKQLKLGEKVSSEQVAKAKNQLGLAKGGYVNCGASVPPAQKAKK